MASREQEEDEIMLEELSIRFDDWLELEDKTEESITLVGLLVVDHEPPQSVVKDILHAIWTNMGHIKVMRAKDNVFAITVSDEEVARRLIDGNPWFIKGNPFTIKHWPLYQSLDDIVADRAIFWVQAHGIPRNLCTMKNARAFGARVGAVLEIEDLTVTGFRGFLRMKLDLDATKPLIPGFNMPCPTTGTRRIRLKYEGLKEFCLRCGRLGHSRGCQWISNSHKSGTHGLFDELRTTSISKVSTSLFPNCPAKRKLESGMDLNNWRGRLEREDGGLYGLSDVSEPNYVQSFVRSQQSTNKSKGTTSTRPAATLHPAPLQHETNSLQTTSQSAPQPQSESLQPALNQPNSQTYKASRADFANRWDPDSFGTQYKNGTLTIAINGLSLNKNGCDPERVPPWDLENADCLLKNRFLDGPHVQGSNPPRPRIEELDLDSCPLEPQFLGTKPKVDKGTNPDPRLVIKRANDSYSEYWEANTCFSRLSSSRTTPSSPYVGRDRWLPPLANAIKINFDGAWSPGTSHGGIGVIARDDCGTWKGGTASPISCNSALVAEAAAALYAVSYAITRDFSKVVFESDSKVFVDSILGNHGNYSWTILPILDEICSLSQHFNEMRWNLLNSDGALDLSNPYCILLMFCVLAGSANCVVFASRFGLF
ncbi:hypothetical protein GBA52_008287 [Prunus armeniaca]|nr:hypothetical protein GBA52_008287 [Prunus armeniaca]